MTGKGLCLNSKKSRLQPFSSLLVLTDNFIPVQSQLLSMCSMFSSNLTLRLLENFLSRFFSSSTLGCLKVNNPSPHLETFSDKMQQNPCHPLNHFSKLMFTNQQQHSVLFFFNSSYYCYFILSSVIYFA